MPRKRNIPALCRMMNCPQTNRPRIICLARSPQQHGMVDNEHIRNRFPWRRTVQARLESLVGARLAEHADAGSSRGNGGKVGCRPAEPFADAGTVGKSDTAASYAVNAIPAAQTRERRKRELSAFGLSLSAMH